MSVDPVAFLFTNVQSGDIEASTDPYDKQGEREYWHQQPLYTATQLAAARMQALEEAAKRIEGPNNNYGAVIRALIT